MTALERLESSPFAVWLVLGVGSLLTLWGWWRQKRYEPGNLPLISPVMVMFTGSVLMFVAAAELVSLLLGSGWTPPFMGRR